VGRATRGCGCAVAVLFLLAVGAGYLGVRYFYPWWKSQPPTASGAELRVHFLDVGPINGDSILIISPGNKTALIDAGDQSKVKNVLAALEKHGIKQLDYFIATHPHPDHLGGAGEIIKNLKVLNIIDNGLSPSLPENLQAPAKTGARTRTRSASPQTITRFFDDYKQALAASGAKYVQAQPGSKIDLGGGVILTTLGPTEPYFTREQMKAGGNEPNANSIVMRLDYGSFSLLLTGDAEAQTENRLLSKDVNLAARVLKVAHHGSKYATSQSFLNRVKPELAVISCGEWNRYGHPSQSVLDRLQAANVKLLRTDLHGEITISTRGRQDDLKITTQKTPSLDIWAGRVAQKDDSSRSGFIAYGDFGPPPKPPAEKAKPAK